MSAVDGGARLITPGIASPERGFVRSSHAWSWRALTAKHALKKRGGLDELASAREACGFANDVLFQHRPHLVLSARAALTAGLACKAPSTETEPMVARASSGETSWAIVARPRTLMCSISPDCRTASRSARL